MTDGESTTIVGSVHPNNRDTKVLLILIGRKCYRFCCAWKSRQLHQGSDSRGAHTGITSTKDRRTLLPNILLILGVSSDQETHAQ